MRNGIRAGLYRLFAVAVMVLALVGCVGGGEADGLERGDLGGVKPSVEELRSVMERPERLDGLLSRGGEKVEPSSGGRVEVVGAISGGEDGGGVDDVSPSGVELLNLASEAMEAVGSGRFKGRMKQWFSSGGERVEVVVGVSGVFSGAEGRAFRFLSGEASGVDGWHVVRKGEKLYSVDMSGDGGWLVDDLAGGEAVGWLFLGGVRFMERDVDLLSVGMVKGGADDFYMVEGRLRQGWMGDVVGLGGDNPEGYRWSFRYLLGRDHLVVAAWAYLVGTEGRVSGVELEFHGYGGRAVVSAPVVPGG